MLAEGSVLVTALGSFLSILKDPAVAVEDTEEDEEPFSIAQSDVLLSDVRALKKSNHTYLSASIHVDHFFSSWCMRMAWVRSQDGGTAFKIYLQPGIPVFFQISGAEGCSAVVDEVKKMGLMILSKSLCCQLCNSSQIA